MQAGEAMKDIRRVGVPATINGQPNPEYALAVIGILTVRQRQVCCMICQGKSNKDIARALAISPRTVEDHRTDVFAKMNVPNSTALVHKVLSARIAELEAKYGED